MLAPGMHYPLLADRRTAQCALPFIDYSGNASGDADGAEGTNCMLPIIPGPSASLSR